jgi:hypothetical protein
MTKLKRKKKDTQKIEISTAKNIIKEEEREQ